MGRPWVVVALLVVLAGCNGLSAVDGGPPTPETTVTPVPVDDGTTETTLAPAALPPGVGENGTVAVQTLLLAHEEYLEDRTYTLVVSYNRTNLATGFSRDDYVKRVEAGDGRLLIDVDRRPDATDRTVYVDETGGYRRLNSSRGTLINYLTYPPDRDEASDVDRYVQEYLAVSGADVDRVERSGRTYYRIHTRSSPSTRLDDAPKARIHNYTLTAYVTPRGFVRSLAVSYEFTYREQLVHVSLRFDYRRIDDTAVATPAWAEQYRGVYNGSLTPTAAYTESQTPTAAESGSQTPSAPRTDGGGG